MQDQKQNDLISKQIHSTEKSDIKNENNQDASSLSVKAQENLGNVGWHQSNNSESNQTTQNIPPHGNVYSTQKVIDDDCTECQLVYKDPTPAEMVLWLHASKYKVSKGMCTFHVLD